MILYFQSKDPPSIEEEFEPGEELLLLIELEKTLMERIRIMHQQFLKLYHSGHKKQNTK